MRKNVSTFRFIAILILILIFLGSVYYVTIKRGKEEFKTDKKFANDKVCKMLYLNGENLEYTVIKNVVSEKFCDDFIESAKSYASENGWTKKRHDDYPTTDNLITKVWPQYDYVTSVVRTKIFEAISKMYPVSIEDLGISEMFVVKYDPKKQSHLEEHEDGSEFSFVIALNDDYKGGGTFFPNLKKLVKLKKGDVLIFSGQNRHRGEEVTEGIRFILTGFLFYKKKDYCEADA